MSTLTELHAHIQALEHNLATHHPTTAAEMNKFVKTATEEQNAVAAYRRIIGGNAQVGKTPPTPKAAGGLVSTLVEGEQTILGQVAKVVPGPAGVVAGAGGKGGALEKPVKALGEKADEAAGGVAAEVASDLVHDVEEAFGVDIVKALLYVALVGGGAALLIAGLARVTGTHPVAAVKHATATGRKLAAVAAA